MGCDNSFGIKKKNGQYVVDEYGDFIGVDIKEVINNFLKAIKSTLEWNEFDFLDDDASGPEYADDWTKIDDGIIPIWRTLGPGWAGGLTLTTPEGIKIFLEVNGYKDIAPEDIEFINVGWDA